MSLTQEQINEMRSQHEEMIAAMSDRELLQTIYLQNAEIMRVLAEGVGALQSFQSGGMGKMIAGMFGSGGK